MWAALVARALAGTGVDQVECETRGCGRGGDCRVLVKLRGRPGVG
jgi:hypothetical protein